MNVIPHPRLNQPDPSLDDFYIGYLPTAPKGLARHTRKTIAILSLGVVTLTLLAAVSQNPIDAGRFEFGVIRSFEGAFYSEPIPNLRVALAKRDGEPSGAVTYLLVGKGKAGIPDEVRTYNGKKVKFKGSLIERENMFMIEMNDPTSLEVLGEPAHQESRGEMESLGEVTLIGEIVDTKCYFGVMRPATGKVHRACAIRCLEGGVPPGLLVRDDQGNGVVFMLAAPEGETLEFDPQWAALEVRVQGLLEIENNIPILRVQGLEMPGSFDRESVPIAFDPIVPKESQK